MPPILPLPLPLALTLEPDPGRTPVTMGMCGLRRREGVMKDGDRWGRQNDEKKRNNE